MAEDFYRAFALGLGPTAIGLGDIDGVTFAGVQVLEARTTERRRSQEALEAKTAEVNALRATLDAALRRLEALEARIAELDPYH